MTIPCIHFLENENAEHALARNKSDVEIANKWSAHCKTNGAREHVSHFLDAANMYAANCNWIKAGDWARAYLIHQ